MNTTETEQKVSRPTTSRKWERIALVAMTALSLVLGLYVLRLRSSQKEFLVPPSDRSWMDGVVTITPYQEGATLHVKVKGSWPTASSSLWIKYCLSVTQEGSVSEALEATSDELDRFQLTGTHLLAVQRLLDMSRPCRFVFDYEIWKGKPGRGELLAKQSVFSEPFTMK
jgi:hypothetical protein